MPRPFKRRMIDGSAEYSFFKPQGMPMRELEEVCLTLDEMEAVRLADFEGLYQAEAAEKMNVSRQTFGNIIKSAHKKIADALINSKAMRIEGGHVEVNPPENDFCSRGGRGCGRRHRGGGNGNGPACNGNIQ